MKLKCQIFSGLGFSDAMTSYQRQCTDLCEDNLFNTTGWGRKQVIVCQCRQSRNKYLIITWDTANRLGRYQPAKAHCHWTKLSISSRWDWAVQECRTSRKTLLAINWALTRSSHSYGKYKPCPNALQLAQMAGDHQYSFLKQSKTKTWALN